MSPTSVPATPLAEVPFQSHPRGLRTLFFTEMWERFSYYGMRALLVLFMMDAVRGGMGMDEKTANAIYGIYTGAVYLLALPGGWLADRLWGAQRAVWYGGIVIAIGHFTLAIPRAEAFFLGLMFVALGSGILKPNMSTLVGDLYPEGGTRRDSGFTIFYMGVNLGAFIGPLVCSALGEKVNWHYGFAAAGVGMVLGLIQFRLTRHHLGSAGIERGSNAPLHLLEKVGLFGGVGGAVVVIALTMTRVISFDAVAIARGLTAVILGIAAVYFASLFLFSGLTRVERQRVGLILVLFLASALFWAGFEQGGSSLNIFAERFTERQWTWLFRFEIPAGWFQSLGAVFIIMFAPVFASFWIHLGRRNLDPSIPAKFGLGLLLLAVGFLVMVGASAVIVSGNRASPNWLILTYLFHTFGELCLSPVGLSSVTKLAPRRLVGQMMGTWFLATALGNVLAGLLAGEFKVDAPGEWSGLYLNIVIAPAAGGLLLILFAKPIKRLMAGAK
ncbi:MAG TPA: peptide MFS transporter [Verrucomicrobiae bacterium]|nr:peptide MFS transporter [Verrucomicrobiae bacterium]